jgi:hypothetical protein
MDGSMPPLLRVFFGPAVSTPLEIGVDRSDRNAARTVTMRERT